MATVHLLISFKKSFKTFTFKLCMYLCLCVGMCTSASTCEVQKMASDHWEGDLQRAISQPNRDAELCMLLTTELSPTSQSPFNIYFVHTGHCTYRDWKQFGRAAFVPPICGAQDLVTRLADSQFLLNFYHPLLHPTCYTVATAFRNNQLHIDKWLIKGT